MIDLSRLTGPILKLSYLPGLRRDEWLSSARLYDLQSRRLRELIAHAYARVPFYRMLFDDAGVRPDQITTADDLPRIPVVTKAMIREQNFENVTAPRGRQSYIQGWTSGSSGVPLALYKTHREMAHRGALAIRGNMSAGIRVFDIRLSMGPPLPTSRSLTQRLGIFRKQVISAFEDLEYQTEAFLALQPDVLAGYPSCLAAVARNLESSSIHRGKPRLICCGGELLLPETRRLLEEVFQCPVIDAYGAEEVGRIAVQCLPSLGFHINADTTIVEILKDGQPVGPGEEGQLVVTSLMSFTMPFIRYVLDDIGSIAPDPCACGRALPLLGSLEGRSDDLIRLPGGVVKHPVVVAYPIVGTPGISKFQVIQEREDYFTILLEKERGFTKQTIADLEGRLRARLGDYKYDIRVVDEIPRQRSGKYRTILSKVPK